MVSITRRETFSAGHRLFNPEWSDERNHEVFGKCANPGSHGHNYVLEVTLSGEVDRSTGFVFDLSELASLMRTAIIVDVDHRNLNTDVEWLSGVIPTAENLAEAFWERLDASLPYGLLQAVRVGETEKNWAERQRDRFDG